MAKRDKSCVECSEMPPTMYRVWVDSQSGWIFVCEDCLLALKAKHSSYRYGGTWKRNKRG